MIDSDDNVVDKETRAVMFKNRELDDMGEIPAPFCVEKFNFNPF